MSTDAPPKRGLLIANARSRNGAAFREAQAAMERAGMALTVVETGSRHDVTPAILEHSHDVDCIIASGGDGTVNALAEGLIKTGMPLGILPMGTANDLARTLGIPTDLQTAAATIVRGKRKRIDVGEVNGHPFFNVASIGLSADLASSLTKERKARFGRLAYAITALHVLITARRFRAAIATKSGVTRVKSLQIAVGNGRYYGGGMAVEAQARIDDGTLDLYSLEFERIWRLVFAAPSFRSGQHGLWQEVRTERCVAFEVRTRRPRPVNTDGELITFTPARFSIMPQAVSVFVP